jgi:hypothetical protein
VIECPCLEKCPFFNFKLANMPATAELLMKKYCRGDFEVCARYQVRKLLGPEHVPQDLFPHDRERADQLVRDGR